MRRRDVYPRAALRELRVAELAQAEERILEVERTRRSCAEQVEAARRALARHTDAAHAEQVTRLAVGAVTGAELGRHDALRRRRRGEREALHEALAQRLEAERAAEDAIAAARAALAAAKAAREAVARDEDRFGAEVRRAAESREEAETEDRLGHRPRS